MPGIRLVIENTDGNGWYRLTVERHSKDTIQLLAERKDHRESFMIAVTDWLALCKKGDLL